jgi:heme/copper-type cytochrome/quinol oxidase subunit 3
LAEAIEGFIATILSGFTFIYSQLFEYSASSFDITDSVYGSTFYTLTGLHGLHVLVGVVFPIVCFVRLLCNHFLDNHYSGFVFAIRYWHFVDVV